MTLISLEKHNGALSSKQKDDENHALSAQKGKHGYKRDGRTKRINQSHNNSQNDNTYVKQKV